MDRRDAIKTVSVAGMAAALPVFPGRKATKPNLKWG